MQQKGKSIMERHIQTVLLSLITAGIIFGCQQIFTLSVSMAKVQVTLEQISANQSKYVTMDFIVERTKSRDQQFADHERRIGKLEALIDAMNLKARPTVSK